MDCFCLVMEAAYFVHKTKNCIENTFGISISIVGGNTLNVILTI